VKRLSLLVEKLRSDVQGLVDVAEIMREQNDRYCLSDLPIVGPWHLIPQDLDTEWDHMHDIEVFSPDTTGSVLLSVLIRENRNVGKVKVSVGRSRGAVRIDEGLQFAIDSIAGQRGPAFEVLNRIRQYRRLLERQTVEQLSKFP
jgi:hypothetical protein